jgi:MinD superfamily P-loop ATPase
VDAADLHLIMDPTPVERHDFQSGHTAIINREKCTECGLCRDLCRWNAIDENFSVDPIACEGCGVCFYFCPEEAVDFPMNTCGEWRISETRFGPMVHARLGIAEENSGKLVTLVRQEAKKLAEKNNLDLILTDGPPGVGCPVIASLGGASAVLIVTEPTVSGKHDMERVAELAAFFKVPAMVCINKFDLNVDASGEIEAFVKGKGLSFLGRIPFDPVFTKAMVQGQTVFEYDGLSQAGEAVRELWERAAGVLDL